MKEQLRGAFDAIRADDEMKTAALSAVRRRREQKARAPLLRARPALAFLCAFALVFGVSGYSVYAAPVSYIGVEAAFSVELCLNRFDRVVAVETADGGEAYLRGLALKNKHYTDAIEAIMASAPLQESLSAGEELVFTVASDKEEALLAGIRACRGAGAGACGSLSVEDAAAARECGLSLGKYKMYRLLAGCGEALTPEDCQGRTMRQLQEQYAALCGETAGAPHPGHGGNGYRGGRNAS